MMPDLGKYAVAVLGSYAATAALVAALVVLSLWRSAQVRRALAEVEARQAQTAGAPAMAQGGK
ncbi:heme exporter protein CcmD [Szabonella alba]|uniref:Heme exporter protein D n=1 Tax=Szabonella alba TaxID=2804194 RepID=A0A8K0XZL9_9RHOB|nr:heme exporter protein CcmD [Szabonella alba]MBL4917265.1 heme exporter protein CcmD [Szabonella alba]